MKKRHVFYIVIAASIVLSGLLTLVLYLNGMFNNYTDKTDIVNLGAFIIFFDVLFFFIGSVIFSSKFSSGVFQEILFIFSSLLLISFILSYLVFALIDCNFHFKLIDWAGALIRMTILF